MKPPCKARVLRLVAHTLALGYVTSSALNTAAATPSWTQLPGARYQSLTLSSSNHIGFTRLSSTSTGLSFSNTLHTARAANNRILENGSGVAIGDVDGDGLPDIFLASIEGASRLYRNLGHLRFVDITPTAGVACEGQASTGVSFADIDGDRDLDLLVNAIGGGTRAFLNDGNGRFSEVLGSRLVRRFGSTSMALADFDGDGDLDLYVTNYRTDTYKDNAPGSKPVAQMVDGKVVVTPPDRFIPVLAKAGGVEVIEQGERDFLYLNDGKGNFLPVSWTSGAFLDEDGKALTKPPLEWGLSVMFRDLNQDGFPDIFVCNDFFHFPDRIWLSEMGRRFRAAPREAFRELSMSSMAVDVADINRDGFDDLLVVDMLSREHGSRHRQKANMMGGELNLPTHDPRFRPEVPRNTLFLNRGDGTYAEIAQLSGLEATEWSWGVLFLDVDLDGFEDVLVATGNDHDVLDADTLKELSTLREAPSAENRLKNLRKFPSLPRHKLAFRNNRDLTFSDTSNPWGFADLGVTTGMACGDLDNDGDLDVVVNQLNGEAGIYRNDATVPRIAVSLQGLPPNTAGIGSRIVLHNAQLTQAQEIIAGGRYLSSDQALRVFAAPTNSSPMTLEVRWRSGRISRLEAVQPGRRYEVIEAEAATTLPTSTTATVAPPQTPTPSAPLWFTDVSARLSHVHTEKPFQDFDRQALMSRRLSKLGPGVAWVDLDGDGIEDLVVGTGNGGRLAAWRNDGNGQFSSFPWTGRLDGFRDDTAGLAGIGLTGKAQLVIGLASYESDPGAPNSFLSLDTPSLTSQALPAIPGASTGPIALADIDGDGDLDLFVGERVNPGHYPAPVGARLYRNANGRWFEDQAQPFKSIGLVSAAVFTDLDHDGFPDLALACEWAAPRVFHNDHGQFSEITQQWGLTSWTGWWNGVTAADFDGDGQLDLAFSNWGRNTRFQHSIQQRPIKAWFGDLDGSGTFDLIECVFDEPLRHYVPWRSFDILGRALPTITERATTYRAYGTNTIESLLGTSFTNASSVEARTLDSMVFLNRGKAAAKPIPLPIEAQFAPAFAVSAGDIDGDGHEDLLLSQNFFDVEYETSRYDAGTGVWLRGLGTGLFKAVPPGESGIRVYGEQRGAALSDFDGDGRLDWVVTQNSGETKLLQNSRGRPGLRCRLNAGPSNPWGVGCTARLVLKSGARSPAKEVHAGSGYWSQDSAVLIFATLDQDPPTFVEVRWPGGKTSRHTIPERAKELRITPETAPERIN